VTEVAVVGHLLVERYLIHEVVGAGAFGRVYRATDLETNEPVALKEFVRQQGRSNGFLRELGVLFDLKHPNIVDCRSVVVSGSFRYLVCEYMEAASFRELLCDESVPVATRLELLVDVAQAVAYAHDHHVIHRDLKPENVLLTRNARPGKLLAKVADFGIATLGEDPSARTCIGSPAYMAPEQFYERYDARIDIYAFGVMLYEVLCGRRPFSGNPVKLMQAHLRLTPELPVWLPRLFRRLLTKTLAKKPERRFDSMHIVAEALSLAIDAELGIVEGHNTPPVRMGSVLQIAGAAGELVVRSSDGLFRLDARRRLIEQQAQCDELLCAPDDYAVRRGSVVMLIGGHGPALFRGVPERAPLSLSALGSLAYTHEGDVIVHEGNAKTGLGLRDATAAAFAGPDQSLVYAVGNRVVWGGSEITLPLDAYELIGHPSGMAVIARPSSADDQEAPRPAILLTPGRQLPIELGCSRVVADRTGFLGVSAEGDLVTLHAETARLGRMRWHKPLVSVGALGDRLLLATRDGQLITA
jgi:serine/threonine-protein kinase